MSWATRWIEALKRGEAVSFRPKGNSMMPHVHSGDLVTVVPSSEFAVGDIVLCRVAGTDYLHFVGAVQGDRYRIQNARGRVNGWVSASQVFGRCTSVEA